MATAVQPFAGIYELDRVHSTVEFAVRHQQIATFRASFRDLNARLRADDDTVALQGQSRVESVSITESAQLELVRTDR